MNLYKIILILSISVAAGLYSNYTAAQSNPQQINTENKNTGDQAMTKDIDELKKKLTDHQFYVTKQNGTERPFANEYWDNHKKGIYVDVISGEPLFSSEDKFDSGTGWPSFSKPIKQEEVMSIEDKSHGMVRTEVRSKTGDAHLGHVFDDGPGPDGQRFCINSASMRFVPFEEMEKEGYGEYKKLFK